MTTTYTCVGLDFVRRRWVRDAIDQSNATLPSDVAHDLHAYQMGVLPGQAQPVERHAAALHAAAEPLREAIRQHIGEQIRLYRGEPIHPPKIDREFLSWTPDLLTAADFAGLEGYHVLCADVPAEDIVGGLNYDLPSGTVELLVRDRPHYHAHGSAVPEQVTVTLRGGRDARRFLRDVPAAGGEVVRIHRTEEGGHYGTAILPGGVALPRHQIDMRYPTPRQMEPASFARDVAAARVETAAVAR